MRKFLAAAVLAGCATPYQQMGFSGGYRDKAIGPRTHSIDVQVNGYTSAGTALEYAYRRAGELCPSGYDVMNSIADKKTSYVRNGNTVNEVNKPEIAIIVQCREQQVPEPQPSIDPQRTSEAGDESAFRIAEPAQPDRKIILGDQAVWCAHRASDSSNGVCEPTQEKCTALRESIGSGVQDLGACVEEGAMACFDFEDVLHGVADIWCAPSVSDCEAQLAWNKTNRASDWKITETMCSIYRRRMGSGK
jgi:hypothetical protein